MLRNSVRSTRIPKTQFARVLRKDLTPGERILWKHIRRRKIHGHKFRRQVPIGPYIVDFLCVEKHLIVEIDGDAHFQDGAQDRDKVREAYLCRAGFHVLRFTNSKTVQETDAVLSVLKRAMGYESD